MRWAVVERWDLNVALSLLFEYVVPLVFRVYFEYFVDCLYGTHGRDEDFLHIFFSDENSNPQFDFDCVGLVIGIELGAEDCCEDYLVFVRFTFALPGVSVEAEEW